MACDTTTDRFALRQDGRLAQETEEGTVTHAEPEGVADYDGGVYTGTFGDDAPGWALDILDRVVTADSEENVTFNVLRDGREVVAVAGKLRVRYLL